MAKTKAPSASSDRLATDDNTPNGDFEHVDSEERNLPVNLTVDELAERGQLLAQLGVEIEDLKEERKQAAASAKADIDEKDAERVKLQKAVAAGQETRPVVCHKEINWEANVVRYRRVDTDEVVDTRAIEADEQQAGLGFEETAQEGQGSDDELPEEAGEAASENADDK
jgi:hypothetical protein